MRFSPILFLWVLGSEQISVECLPITPPALDVTQSSLVSQELADSSRGHTQIPHVLSEYPDVGHTDRSERTKKKVDDPILTSRLDRSASNEDSQPLPDEIVSPPSNQGIGLSSNVEAKSSNVEAKSSNDEAESSDDEAESSGEQAESSDDESSKPLANRPARRSACENGILLVLVPVIGTTTLWMTVIDWVSKYKPFP